MRTRMAITTAAMAAALGLAASAPASAIMNGKLTSFDPAACETQEIQASFVYVDTQIAEAIVDRNNQLTKIVGPVGLGVVTIKNISKRTCAIDNATNFDGLRDDWGVDHFFDHTPTWQRSLPRITWRDFSKNYVNLKPDDVAQMQFTWVVGSGSKAYPKTMAYADFWVVGYKSNDFSLNGAPGLNGAADSWHSPWRTVPREPPPPEQPRVQTGRIVS